MLNLCRIFNEKVSLYALAYIYRHIYFGYLLWKKILLKMEIINFQWIDIIYTNFPQKPHTRHVHVLYLFCVRSDLEKRQIHVGISFSSIPFGGRGMNVWNWSVPNVVKLLFLILS